MKSHMLIVIAALALTSCASGGAYTGYSSKPSETVYVRDTRGSTVYRIQDGNIFTPNGTRVGRITKK
jgi:outer membrane lipoprotein SlyB